VAWEDRNGNSYYYRKRREGKRVVSDYVGNGFLGQLAEAVDIDERYEENLARTNFRKQKRNVKLIDEQVREVEKYIRAVTRAVLLLSGYHSHKRQWRKRRNVRRRHQDND
jgi:hypothetical protein